MTFIAHSEKTTTFSFFKEIKQYRNILLVFPDGDTARIDFNETGNHEINIKLSAIENEK